MIIQIQLSKKILAQLLVLQLEFFLGCAYTDPTTGQFTPNQYFPASTAADDISAYVCT